MSRWRLLNNGSLLLCWGLMAAFVAYQYCLTGDSGVLPLQPETAKQVYGGQACTYDKSLSHPNGCAYQYGDTCTGQSYVDKGANFCGGLQCPWDCTRPTYFVGYYQYDGWRWTKWIPCPAVNHPSCVEGPLTSSGGFCECTGANIPGQCPNMWYHALCN